MGLFQFKVGWFKIKARTNLEPQNYMYLSAPDGQIAKKLSGTQAIEVKKLIIFSSFFNHNFEDTVTNFHKDMLRKETLMVK